MDDKQELSRKLFAQAVALAKKNLWSEAEATFVESARLASTSLAWLGAAIACWRQQRFDQAATCVEWALHAIPIRETAESQAGLNRFGAEDWTGVDEAFRPLLSRPPVDTPTHLFLCIAQIHLGRLDEAGDQLMASWNQELADSEPSQGGQALQL